MPSLVVYKGYSIGRNWASQVLFITYTIIEGQDRPTPVLNLDHANTGCVQRVMLGNTCAIFSHIKSLGFRSGLRMCSIPTMPSLAVYKGYRIGHDGRHGCKLLHIHSLRVWSGLLLCAISIMPSLVVYKRILYRSGWASQVLFIIYTIIEGQVGLGLCSILTMPSLVVYKGYRSSRVLFFTYTIIDGFIEPEHMRNRISLVGHH